MLRWICVLACLYMAVGAAFAEPVTLRARVEANSAQITLGDVFQGAPAEVAARPIGPAPPPGQISTLPVPLLSALASAAGLEWTPPQGLAEVRVVRPGGARATVAAASLTPVNALTRVSDAAVRRNEPVTLVYQTGGVSLTLRGRALEDAAVGQPVRVLNTASNRTIDAIVTGPGVARTNP